MIDDNIVRKHGETEVPLIEIQCSSLHKHQDHRLVSGHVRLFENTPLNAREERGLVRCGETR
jgi:hypothetical protein